MKIFFNILTFTCLSFFINSNLFAAGPAVELIAADQSSHVCKIGTYAGWNALSGTNVFNKLLEFQNSNFSTNEKNIKFKADWLNYNVGVQFSYTRFFDRYFGWNLLDFKGGYNKHASFSPVSSDKKNENFITYRGLSVDLMTGVAFNFWEDGLDFEEGNQFGNRFVLNLNGGVNFNFCAFDIEGESSFTGSYLPAHFAESSKLYKIIVEPSLEWVLICGFYSKIGVNVGYFGPWQAEKQNNNATLAKNKKETLPDTFTLCPTLEFGWDFSALIN